MLSVEDAKALLIAKCAPIHLAAGVAPWGALPPKQAKQLIETRNPTLDVVATARAMEIAQRDDRTALSNRYMQYFSIARAAVNEANVLQTVNALVETCAYILVVDQRLFASFTWNTDVTYVAAHDEFKVDVSMTPLDWRH